MKHLSIAGALFLVVAFPAAAQQLSASDRVALQIGQLVIQVEQMREQNAALQKQIADIARDKASEAARGGAPDKHDGDRSSR